MEAARRGKPLQARWALVPAEFEAIITSLSTHTDKEVGTWLAAYFIFMYNMVARLDDTSKFRLPDLQPFHQFLDYGVTSKLVKWLQVWQPELACVIQSCNHVVHERKICGQPRADLLIGMV